jgi:uncharacterized protein (UPF0335 family)
MAVANKAAKAAETQGETPTISINGGPHVSMDTVKQALEIIKGSMSKGLMQQCREEAESVLGRVYGDKPIPPHEIEEVARSVYQRLSGSPASNDNSATPVEHAKLKSYIERIERLEEDKAGIGSDIKDVFAEAKSNGFDTKAMRGVLKLRKLTTNERTEREYMLDLYKKALGMQPSFDFEGGE